MVLAKEAGLCYASVAMITDYDCWRSAGDNVHAEAVVEQFKKNVKKVTDLLVTSVIEIGNRNWDETIDKLQVFYYYYY